MSNKTNSLNVIFVTQDEPFFLPLFFNEFNRVHTDNEINVLGAVILAPLGESSIFSLAKRMYSFYGLFNFFRVGFRFAVYKALNLLAVHCFKGKFPGTFSVRHSLLKNGYQIFSFSDVNAEEFINFVKENEIDLLVSVGGSQKFRSQILTAPKLACINVHNAKLPKNRGMLPTFWAMFQYDEDSSTAMTVFKMDENLDSGEIILQENVQLNPHGESLEELIIKMKKKNAPLLMKAIQMFKNGTPPLHPNDDSKATYFSFPKSEDVKKFKSKGYKLL